MRGRYLLVTILVFGIILSFIGLKTSLDVHKRYSNSLTSYSFTDEGNISFFVEPGGGSTGGGSGGGGGGGSGGGSGGGGGGGGVVTGIPNFKVNPGNINIQAVSGRAESKEITIENTGTRILAIDVFVTGLEDSIILESNKIYLKPGEKKTVILTINARSPGVYTGKVIFSYQGIKKEVLVLFNVISEGVLFDISITIPENYKIIKAGKKLPTAIELRELGDEATVDVNLKYLIKDFNDNLIYEESERIFVNGTKRFNKEFDTSKLDAGDYAVGVELTYPEGFASASTDFKITKIIFSYATLIAILILILAIIIVIFAWRYYRGKGIKSIKKKKNLAKRGLK